MDKIIFVDFQTKIVAGWLNTVSNTVWDALGQASTPQEARQFIGAIPEAPNDGKAYLRANLSWLMAETALLHNDIGGRSIESAHPTSAITGLDAALAEKAPLESPALTGNPTAPTPAPGDNDTSIATTGFVKAAIDSQSSSGMLPSNDPPTMNGVAFAGVEATGSRSDHVHPTDTSRAPSSAATASGTSFTPSGTIAASTVQAAIAELDSETQTSLGGKAPSSAATATGTSFAPTGTVSASNVQAAIQELDSETQTALGGKAPSSAATATGTSFTPTGTISATNVQAAIEEVAAEAGGTRTQVALTGVPSANVAIPAGATRIKIAYLAVGMANAGSGCNVRMSSGGTFVNTGYGGSRAQHTGASPYHVVSANDTSFVVTTVASTGGRISGHFEAIKMADNTWVMSSVVSVTVDGIHTTNAGTITLPGECDAIQLLSGTGATNFSTGSAMVTVEY